MIWQYDDYNKNEKGKNFVHFGDFMYLNEQSLDKNSVERLTQTY
jgi:hypothetical protein